MRETFEWATEQQREGAEVLSNLAAIADVQAVFSDPIEAGDYTIITASENFAGLGFGSGFGGGTGMMGRREESQAEEGSGFGGGAGGGGGAQSRPVAAIIIGPEGVRVEPIVDVTKFMLALFTTLGGMALMFARMQRKSRG
ncbi:MAG: hypothetical protein GX484_00835 [Chloroflexi bacterium]|nr:hypothetical protein [Chloroflexota bacterium]